MKGLQSVILHYFLFNWYIEDFTLAFKNIFLSKMPFLPWLIYNSNNSIKHPRGVITFHRPCRCGHIQYKCKGMVVKLCIFVEKSLLSSLNVSLHPVIHLKGTFAYHCCVLVWLCGSVCRIFADTWCDLKILSDSHLQLPPHMYLSFSSQINVAAAVQLRQISVVGTAIFLQHSSYDL